MAHPPPPPPSSPSCRRGFSSPIWRCLLLSNVFFAGILFGVSICIHYPEHFQLGSNPVADLRRDLFCLLIPPSSSPARELANGERSYSCDDLAIGTARLPALQGTFYRLLVPLAGGGPRRGLDKNMSLRLATETFRLLSHVLSDEELLSLGSARVERPVVLRHSWPSKIAFLFLTRGPLPFAPVWERFFRGHEDKFSVYVHATPGFSFREDAPEVFKSALIRSEKVRWGESSLGDAERRLLATALMDFQNQRFVLLSESCIPVANFSFVYDYLVGTNQSFTDCVDDLSPWGRGRYRYEMLPEIRVEQWRKGSQWFGLKREHATTVVSDTVYYPKLKKWCIPHCYVDEHYMPTMLSILDPQGLANRTTTYTDWSRGGMHPRSFRGGEVSAELIHSIQNDATCMYNGRANQPCWLFARKFEPSALHPLMKILRF